LGSVYSTAGLAVSLGRKDRGEGKDLGASGEGARAIVFRGTPPKNERGGGGRCSGRGGVDYRGGARGECLKAEGCAWGCSKGGRSLKLNASCGGKRNLHLWGGWEREADQESETGGSSRASRDPGPGRSISRIHFIRKETQRRGLGRFYRGAVRFQKGRTWENDHVFKTG